LYGYCPWFEIETMPSLYLQFVRSKHDFILYFISIVGVLVCLWPLFLLDSLYTPLANHKFILSDDFVANHSIKASLFIVIIPLVDVLLDFCQNIWDWFKEKKIQKKLHNDTAIYRLTEGERFVFIIGMILQSTISFLPSSNIDIIDIMVIYDCTRTASQFFFLVPLLFYFKRCTTTFNIWITSSIIVPFSIGLMLFSLKILYHKENHVLHDQMQQSAVVFIVFAIILFLSTVFVSFCSYLIRVYSIVTDRPFCTNSFMNSIYNYLTRSKFDESQNDKNVDFMYTHLIPAMHMFAYVIISVGGLLRITRIISFVLFNTISLIGQTIVLVIELRIRKNEIARGLVEFLMSLVHFISVFLWVYITSY
jgi:hypothetical protein